MEHGLTAYCNVTFLDEIISERKKEPYKSAYQMLYRLSDIYLDINHEALKEKVNSSPIYNRLLTGRGSNGIHSKLEWRLKVDLNNIADEVFFISDDYIPEYKKVRESKGALIVSSNDVNYLTRINRLLPFSLIPEDNLTGLEKDAFNSWHDIFSKKGLEPINALIINDNFLFGDTKKFDERKEYSIYDLLKTVVPKDLDIDFHLTFFFCNDKANFTQQEARQVIADIKRLCLTNDPEKMKVSIIAHTCKKLTHDRHLLSNYFFANSGKGYNVIDANGIQEVAQGESKCVFHSISDLAGESTIKDQYNLCQHWLKLIYTKQKGMGTQNTFIEGDDFVNRLLK